MNDNIKLKIIQAYKVPRLTNFVDGDIKLIKKLNQVLQRLEKYEKDQYILEATNIIKTLDNVFDLNLLYPVLCQLIDIRFHSTILFIYDKILILTKDDYKKLQELAQDDEQTDDSE
jgi:hypothetical protein